MEKEITFNGMDRYSWIKAISNWESEQISSSGSTVKININDITKTEELEPIHIVLLACFIQKIFDLGYEGCSLNCKHEVKRYLIDDISLPQYWGTTKSSHIDSPTETIFNLWHVSDDQKEIYSDQTHQYLKRHFFKNRDLSTIKNSLLEIFYNIFDHADAKGNCFSLMKYDKDSTRLHVAVCDFGKGIAKSMRDCFVDIDCDQKALQEAVKSMITTRSQSHNMGMGLGNILDHIQDGDTLKIVSNRAILILAANQMKVMPLDAHFPGTLIFYDISLSNFEIDENYATFELDFDF